jgi:hypothetical protein
MTLLRLLNHFEKIHIITVYYNITFTALSGLTALGILWVFFLYFLIRLYRVVEKCTIFKFIDIFIIRARIFLFESIYFYILIHVVWFCFLKFILINIIFILFIGILGLYI